MSCFNLPFNFVTPNGNYSLTVLWYEALCSWVSDNLKVAASCNVTETTSTTSISHIINDGFCFFSKHTVRANNGHTGPALILSALGNTSTQMTGELNCLLSSILANCANDDYSDGKVTLFFVGTIVGSVAALMGIYFVYKFSWDYVCQRISGRQRQAIREETKSLLSI